MDNNIVVFKVQEIDLKIKELEKQIARLNKERDSLKEYIPREVYEGEFLKIIDSKEYFLANNAHRNHTILKENFDLIKPKDSKYKLKIKFKSPLDGWHKDEYRIYEQIIKNLSNNLFGDRNMIKIDLDESYCKIKSITIH